MGQYETRFWQYISEINRAELKKQSLSPVTFHTSYFHDH